MHRSSGFSVPRQCSGYTYCSLNFLLNRSTRPAASTIRCSPVKNGWHLLHTSTFNMGWVEPVLKLLPQAQVTLASGKYFG